MEANVQAIIYSTIKNTSNKNAFSRGKFSGLDIIIMNKNGYINATKICDNKNETFNNWIKERESLDYIDFLSAKINIPRDDMITDVDDNNNDVVGTYVHPELIVNIASWCSPSFACKVNRCVLDYFAEEAVLKKDKSLREKCDIIAKQDIKIAKLRKIVDKYKKQASEKIRAKAKKYDSDNE